MVTAVHPGWDMRLSMVAIAHALVAAIGRILKAKTANIKMKHETQPIVPEKAISFLYKKEESFEAYRKENYLVSLE